LFILHFLTISALPGKGKAVGQGMPPRHLVVPRLCS
jgi:hypothetical protein